MADDRCLYEQTGYSLLPRANTTFLAIDELKSHSVNERDLSEIFMVKCLSDKQCPEGKFDLLGYLFWGSGLSKRCYAPPPPCARSVRVYDTASSWQGGKAPVAYPQHFLGVHRIENRGFWLGRISRSWTLICEPDRFVLPSFDWISIRRVLVSLRLFLQPHKEPVPIWWMPVEPRPWLSTPEQMLCVIEITSLPRVWLAQALAQ